MIQLPQSRESDFESIEKAVKDCTSLADLSSYYAKLIDNYERLNAKYFFSQSFSKDYVYEQLKNFASIRSRELFAIPFGVKDVFNTKVLPTTMGSEIWAGFKAGNNARIVDEIVDRGGVVFSKTTTAEFAVHYIPAGKTLNPHDAGHITGTSSAGSAVAVACGALPIALGTQTAGSIIRPASFCGVFGFKPSFGAYDRTGVLKTADTLDTIGLLGSSIYGLRKTFGATYQKDWNYSNSKRYSEYKEKYAQKKTLRVGIITDQFKGYSKYDSEIRADFDQLIESVCGQDVTFEKVEKIEFINEIHPLHATIYNKSLSYYFQEEYSHGTAMSPLMSEMIDIGNKISARDFSDALSKQPMYRSKFDPVFEKYDFLVTSSTATPAPKLGEREVDDTCLIWSFFGYPVLGVPVFKSKEQNLPYGLQIVAPKFCDFPLLSFGQLIIDRLRSKSTV